MYQTFVGWNLPNATKIGENSSANTYYTSRGSYGKVTLNRPYNITSPTGQFCCKVPDVYYYVTHTLCTILSKLTNPHYIATLPTSFMFLVRVITAGEKYTLECSADGSIVTFEWLGPLDGRTPIDNYTSSIAITSNSTTSQLQFRPLQQSHNGSYLCRIIMMKKLGCHCQYRSV